MKNYFVTILLGFLLVPQLLLGMSISRSRSSKSMSFGPFSYAYVREKCLVNGYEVIGWSDDLQENEVFLYIQCTARNFKAYLEELGQNPCFNEVYETLSRDDRTLLKSYYKKLLKFYDKAKNMGRIDWNEFEQEAVSFLKPYEALAEKFARIDYVLFDLAVGSKSGTWHVGCYNKWPNGFGIDVIKDMRVCPGTPTTVEEFMSVWLESALFVKVYQSLLDREKMQLQEFVHDTLGLYAKVSMGYLNHTEFNSEVRALLQPYRGLASKFLSNGVSIFFMTAIQSDGTLFKVGYNGSIDITCTINFPKK